MRLITSDDFIDTYCKIIQRGRHFVFSKFTLDKKTRTKSAFDDSAFSASNWWIIPAVRQRWNSMITGNPEMNYKQYLYEHFVRGKSGLKLLSLGSGVCSHELELAGYTEFSKIVCLDLAQNLLDVAHAQAKREKKDNIKFICSDIKNYDFKDGYFDFVLFNASLHHFEDVEKLVESDVKKCLKPSGKLVINEYVGPNRQQYPREQIAAINSAISSIDKPLRTRFKTKLYKSKFSGPGLWRMIVADPSECVDSKNILPAVHKNFITILEKPFGGNILMGTLKDISHHFVELDRHKKEVLNRLFAIEDEYLKSHQSDYLFGIYGKK
jgi:ubiquinone/menaquinone biosynthesis C-methylase UbiE